MAFIYSYKKSIYLIKCKQNNYHEVSPEDIDICWTIICDSSENIATLCHVPRATEVTLQDTWQDAREGSG